MENSLPLIGEWFTLRWFFPETFSAYNWEMSHFLFLLFLIPLLFLLRWLFYYKSSRKLTIALPESELKSHWSSWLRFIPDILFSLFIALIIVALARPQKTTEKTEQWTEGIDIIMTIDISESMQLMDFEPNRMVAAKAVATDFINGRFQDRIGLVIFSGEAYSLSPLSTDYKLLNTLIEEIDFGKIEARGTAIGSALAVSINRLRESEANSKVIILLSDGDNNAGNIDPITAANLADAYGITVYTIGMGKDGRVPMGRGPFGQVRYIDNNLDETTLREIAKIGQGKYYRATDNQGLQQIFDEIDALEKSEIKETRFSDTVDYYVIYLKWAILLLLLWLLLKSTFISNVLSD
ncbi:MAG: VWA domain-containing protein [Cyclobacteriaceae bacterium]